MSKEFNEREAEMRRQMTAIANDILELAKTKWVDGKYEDKPIIFGIAMFLDKMFETLSSDGDYTDVEIGAMITSMTSGLIQYNSKQVAAFLENMEAKGLDIPGIKAERIEDNDEDGAIFSSGGKRTIH